MSIYKKFKNRRNNLADKLGDGLAIIFNSDELSRNRDCNYPFRSDSYFHYLSGFPEAEAVIIVFGGENPRTNR